MEKTALIIGASGLVGRALVDQLVACEHIGKVIPLTRRPLTHSSFKVFNQVVDFDHLENYSDFFKVDMLFSCLGTTVKQAGSISAQRKVDLAYQLKAAKIAVENDVGHYLLVSSSGANAQSKSAYFKMKGELEVQVQSLAFKRISIIQPSLLVGTRNEFRFAEKLGAWILPCLGFIPGLRRYRPISGVQVAKKMCSISSQSGPDFEVYRLDELFQV